MRWRHPLRGVARLIGEGFQHPAPRRAEKAKTFARGSARIVGGADALLWGVETPLLPVGAGRDGTKLLDLMVGEPVAYTTGFPS